MVFLLIPKQVNTTENALLQGLSHFISTAIADRAGDS